MLVKVPDSIIVIRFRSKYLQVRAINTMRRNTRLAEVDQGPKKGGWDAGDEVAGELADIRS